MLEELRHPFICGYHGFMQDQYQIYFITELLDGGCLFDYYAEKNKLSLDETRFYGA